MTDIRVDQLVFPECLRWRDNHLWFVDMYAGSLHRMAPNGICETLYQSSSILGGIGWLPDGQLVFVDKTERKIFSLEHGRAILYADLSALGHSPLNDLLILRDGTILVGEYGFNIAAGEGFQKGSVFSIVPSGEIRALSQKFAFPNGMIETDVDGEVIIAETMGSRLTKLSLGGRNTAVEASQLTKFASGHPDGIALDKNGWVWSALVGASSIWAVDLQGRQQSSIELDIQPYDVCWADAPSRLYIAVSAASPKELQMKPAPRKGAIFEVAL